MKRAASRAEVSAIIALHEEALSAPRPDGARPELHDVRGKVQDTIRGHVSCGPEIEFDIAAQIPSSEIDCKRIGIGDANIFLSLNASAGICLDGADLDIDERWLRTRIRRSHVHDAVTRQIADARSKIFVFDAIIGGLEGIDSRAKMGTRTPTGAIRGNVGVRVPIL